MINYLERNHLVRPSIRAERRRGKSRLYGFGDLVMLRILGKLLSYGVSVAKLRVALGQLRATLGSSGLSSREFRYLLTDGSRIYLTDGEYPLELTDGGQLNFGFFINIEEVREEVLREMPDNDALAHGGARQLGLGL